MEKTEIVCCPVCGELLKEGGKNYVCKNKHCFDVSKEGYVNLLLVGNKKTKNPGDDKLMVTARKEFLEKGYFEKLLEEVVKICKNERGRIVLDAGCGTGYYLKGLSAELPDKNFIGVDISKSAIKLASKSDKKSLYIVSSIFDMPFFAESVDIILNIFAPKPEKEFERVLKRGGCVVEVVPGRFHLKELKELIYKTQAKENQEKFAFHNFLQEDGRVVLYKQKLSLEEDVKNLLKMTPYWYKGGQKEEFLGEGDFEVTFHFLINVWRK